MKFSIDYHNGELKGWVATDNLDTQVHIKDSMGREYSTQLGEPRKSVIDKGISKNLNCGFSFINILKPNIEGDFFTIKISNSEESITTTKFCGDITEWRDKFESFQIADRRDFSCQLPDTLELFDSHSDIIAFKILMIRLRRGKRAHNWRGSFKGHKYPLMEKDWVFFKSFYTKYFSILSKVLAPRSLWSCIDTFVDFGDPLEQACALAVSNFMYQERFAQTGKAIYQLIPFEETKNQKQIPYWGMMLSNRLELDDAYDIFLTKNIKILEYVPIVKKTFAVLFLDALDSNDSIISMNASNSAYFTEAFDFYRKFFEGYLK